MVVLCLELLSEKRLFLRLVPVGEGEFFGAGAGVDAKEKVAVFVPNRPQSRCQSRHQGNNRLKSAR